jgi:hypothetical protein
MNELILNKVKEGKDIMILSAFVSYYSVIPTFHVELVTQHLFKVKLFK